MQFDNTRTTAVLVTSGWEVNYVERFAKTEPQRIEAISARQNW